MWNAIAVTRKVTRQILCLEAKPKDSKGTFKVRKVEDPVLDKVSDETKSNLSNPHSFLGSDSRKAMILLSDIG